VPDRQTSTDLSTTGLNKKMTDIFRDPIWQFVGVLLALFAIAMTFWIYWLQRQTKELAFGLVSSRRLLAIADEMSPRVTVQLDGKLVSNLHLLVYAIKNSGHKAIATSDFVRAPFIAFSDGQIVSVEVASQCPENMRAELTLFSTKVELSPLLLNPGDQLLIQVLLSSSKPSATFDARIVDVSAHVALNYEPRIPRFFDSGLPMAMYFMAGIGGGALVVAESREMPYVYFGLAIFIPIFGFFNRLWRDQKPSARRRVRGT
jgi:hypothetical protein